MNIVVMCAIGIHASNSRYMISSGQSCNNIIYRIISSKVTLLFFYHTLIDIRVSLELQLCLIYVISGLHTK